MLTSTAVITFSFAMLVMKRGEGTHQNGHA